MGALWGARSSSSGLERRVRSGRCTSLPATLLDLQERVELWPASSDIEGLRTRAYRGGALVRSTVGRGDRVVRGCARRRRLKVARFVDISNVGSMYSASLGTRRSRISLVNAEDRYGARSYLYVPGDSQRRLDRALAWGADAVILDLEDAVAATAKAEARVLVGRWISEHEAAEVGLWVRLNGGSLALDSEGIVGVNLTGIVVPKAELAVLAEADELLALQERRAALPHRSIAVLPLIETARGLMSAADLAVAPRVARLGIGEADLAADLRMELTDAGDEMMPLRLQVVVASAAAGIDAPVAPVARDYHDLQTLRQSTLALRGLGFRARTAIHPAQVTVINEVFTPTAEEIYAARQLVDSFAASERAGSGVLIDGRGQMVDAAVVRTARETLRRAGISFS